MAQRANKRGHRRLAVLLGLADTGYGVVRSLAQRGVPIVAFESATGRPEAWTKSCRVRHFAEEGDLLQQLLRLSEESDAPPVLYITSDALVRFYSDHREILEGRFLVDFPDRDAVRRLLEKDSFVDFALENDLRIPATSIVSSAPQCAAVPEAMRYPCVVKPYWRTRRWKEAGFPKVLTFHDKAALARDLEGIFRIEERLIVQEWIPGSDDAVFFHLVYFDAESRCIAEFTGRKLRQWPVGTGSTTCAEPVVAEAVRRETIRLFERISYSGFGSVEFKRHQKTGEFFITEPTVGRPNHQSYLATANGVNMPWIAYCSLTGGAPGASPPPSRPASWIDDEYDLLSIAVSLRRRRLNLRHLVRSYLGVRSFRLFNPHDMGPFLHLLLHAPFRVLRKAFGRRGTGSPRRARR